MAPRKLNTNWISAYSAALKPITEAPDSYVIWCAISVISAVLKKKVWIDRGTYTVYPNQYIVLVGPPGVGKGSSIHPAHSFIKDYKPALSNYLSDRQTAPKIIEQLDQGWMSNSVINGQVVTAKESTCCLQATELSTFLSSSDWMTSFLCATWDQNEFEYGTKGKGNNSIKDMCISLIGACTPDFIRKINGRQNAAEAINGGFTARTIFVFAAEKSKRLPWPERLENQIGGKDLVTNLRYDLEQIAQIKGEFTFSPDASYRWTKYYHAIKADEHDSEVVQYFKSRQDIHILKVAMCMAAAANDTLVIDLWSLNTAITLVEGVIATLDVTFRGIGESSLSEATAKVQTFLEKKGLTYRRELIKAMHRHATMEDIDRILNLLLTMGLIRLVNNGVGQAYEYIIPGSGPKGSKP